MPELCNGLCSELKFQFFLDVLIAIGTLLMAGVAIAALDSWRRQKKSEIALEIYNFLIAVSETLGTSATTVKRAYESNSNYKDFMALDSLISPRIDKYKFKASYAISCKHILKEDEISRVVAMCSLSLVDLEKIFAAFCHPSFKGKASLAQGENLGPFSKNIEEAVQILDRFHRMWQSDSRLRNDVVAATIKLASRYT